ncbi:MAG: LysR family transcriptional regulator [Rhodospirillaceae bacterium]
MKLDTLGLQAFIGIVDHGTFAKAAQSLNISQTALSHRLKRLEGQLRARLLDRTTRSWSLTAIGAEFLPVAKRLVTDLDEAFKAVRSRAEGRHGSVTLASVTTVAFHLLPQVVMQYSRRHPQHHVRVLEMASPAVIDAVLQRRADFGINVVARRHADLNTEVIYEDPYVLICREDHAYARRRQLRWRDIAGQPVISLGPGSANGILLGEMLRRLDFEVKAHYETQRSTTAVAMAALGLGLAILPRLAMRGPAFKGLRAIPLIEPAVTRKLALVRHKGASLSHAAQTLYETMREVVAANDTVVRLAKTRARHTG